MTFHCIGPLGKFSYRVFMSVCLYVCMYVPLQNTHFERSTKFWSKVVSLILVFNDIILFSFSFFFVWVIFFLHFSAFRGFWKPPTVDHPTVSQPTVDNGGVSDPPPLPSLLPPYARPYYFFMLRYWCYYPHWSKDSLSHICGIFPICEVFSVVYTTKKIGWLRLRKGF